MPKCQNMLADVTSWLLRRQPELKDPKILLDNLKCKGKWLPGQAHATRFILLRSATGLAMESYGTLQFQLHTIMRGARKLGYHWHA